MGSICLHIDILTEFFSEVKMSPNWHFKRFFLQLKLSPNCHFRRYFFKGWKCLSIDILSDFFPSRKMSPNCHFYLFFFWWVKYVSTWTFLTEFFSELKMSPNWHFYLFFFWWVKYVSTLTFWPELQKTPPPPLKVRKTTLARPAPSPLATVRWIKARALDRVLVLGAWSGATTGC